MISCSMMRWFCVERGADMTREGRREEKREEEAERSRKNEREEREESVEKRDDDGWSGVDGAGARVALATVERCDGRWRRASEVRKRKLQREVAERVKPRLEREAAHLDNTNHSSLPLVHLRCHQAHCPSCTVPSERRQIHAYM